MLKGTFKPRLRIPKEELFDLYSVQKWSCHKIAEHFGCGTRTINRLRRRFGIEKKQLNNTGYHPRRNDIKKDFLFREYITNRKSPEQIGAMLNCDASTIFKRLLEFKIKTRSRGETLRGIPKSPELKRKLSIAQKARGLVGKKHPNWRGGIVTNLTAIRNSLKYHSFRRLVLSIRGKTCEKCGKTLIEACPTCNHIPDRHVHHIKPFSRYAEERFSETNVLVLCDSCHKSQHFKKEPFY